MIILIVCHFEKNHGDASLILNWKDQYKIKEKKNNIIKKYYFIFF